MSIFGAQILANLSFGIYFDINASREFRGANGYAGNLLKTLLKQKKDIKDHENHAKFLIQKFDPNYPIKVQDLRVAHKSPNQPTLKFRESLSASPKMVDNCSKSSFACKKGEILGFIGNNGAGKSLICGAMSITGEKRSLGTVFLQNRQLDQLNLLVAGCEFSTVFKENEMFGEFTLDELMEYFRLVKGVNESEAFFQVNFLTKVLGLKKLRYKRLVCMSKGERRQALVAASLVGSPKIDVLNKPFDGVDYVA